MIFLIPLGGRAHWHAAPDSWVLTEYRVSSVASNSISGIGAVAGNKIGDLFDGLPTLCYIEFSRGKFSAAMLFARFANLIFKGLNRLQEAT